MAKGMIRLLTALIGAAMLGAKTNDSMKEVNNLSRQKNALLMNGFGGCYPSRLSNQRQRRRLARQTGRY